MADQRAIVVCSCEDTLPVDAQALHHGCRNARLVTGRLFCRSELERFRELVATGAPITMGCTQEAPLFREVAAPAMSFHDPQLFNPKDQSVEYCGSR
jgi:hypothetical protein